MGLNSRAWVFSTSGTTQKREEYLTEGSSPCHWLQNVPEPAGLSVIETHNPGSWKFVKESVLLTFLCFYTSPSKARSSLRNTCLFHQALGADTLLRAQHSHRELQTQSANSFWHREPHPTAICRCQLLHHQRVEAQCSLGPERLQSQPASCSHRVGWKMVSPQAQHETGRGRP